MDMFLVNDNHCSSCGRIRGTFSTLERARAFLAEHDPPHSAGMGWSIEHWIVDEPLDGDGLTNVEEVSA